MPRAVAPITKDNGIGQRAMTPLTMYATDVDFLALAYHTFALSGRRGGSSSSEIIRCVRDCGAVPVARGGG